MNKIKNIVALVIFTIIIYSCNDSNYVNPYADIDHEALAVLENDSIKYFLNTHYYDTTLDSIKIITGSETPMLEETSKLSIIKVTENEIEHELYVYVTEEGIPDLKDKFNPSLGRKNNPTEMDSIFVNRKGVLLLKNSIDLSNPFDDAEQTWWSLVSTYGLVTSAPSPIKAWVKGFPVFKSGQNKTDNGPITYSNTGKGYIFIPSGLAYSSINYQLGQTPSALFDLTLVFKVELIDIVEDTDHDNDGKATIDEDLDKDGDPSNDFSDPDNSTLPDYLNADVN
jgi:hypothetical protein